MTRPKRFVVGLTGGIATGKSSALAEFARLGAATVSLDAIAREQARPGRAGHRAIVRRFGARVLAEDGAVDRGLLGRIVFSDEAARRALERATHPFILKEMKTLIGRSNGVVIVDVPLLFEKNLQNLFDAVMLISCRPEKQMRRVVDRDRLSAAQARRRLKAQWPLAKKRALADVVIDNDGSLPSLRKNIRGYHAGLQLLYGGTPNGNVH